MIIIYIDIILLIILLLLILFTCVYCVYRVHRLQRTGQDDAAARLLELPMSRLLRHIRKSREWCNSTTVVAYQNPFTGDYCVHKSRMGPKGYVNSAMTPESPDSGVSDEYEPLKPVPHSPQPVLQEESQNLVVPEVIKSPLTPVYDNSVIKTWNWDYTEYQI